VLGVHAVDEVADHLLGEVDFGIGVFSGEAFEGVNGDALEGDVAFVGGDDFADFGVGAAGELGGVALSWCAGCGRGDGPVRGG
jgi:hypothetical protein